MPTFSFTAPIISVEQEIKEVEGLDDDEREKIRKGLYGNTDSSGLPGEIMSVDTDVRSVRQRGGYSTDSNVYEAFAKEIQKSADKDKRDFLEALKVAPNLVATESDPTRFLTTFPSPEVCCLKFVPDTYNQMVGRR
jgi:hypothetical protein